MQRGLKALQNIFYKKHLQNIEYRQCMGKIYETGCRILCK